MKHSPERVFQSFALEVGLKAKQGAVSMRDKLHLAKLAMRCGAHCGPRYCEVTLHVLDLIDHQPLEASGVLMAFLSEILPPDAVQQSFDWQNRADFQ